MVAVAAAMAHIQTKFFFRGNQLFCTVHNIDIVSGIFFSLANHASRVFNVFFSLWFGLVGCYYYCSLLTDCCVAQTLFYINTVCLNEAKLQLATTEPTIKKSLHRTGDKYETGEKSS